MKGIGAKVTRALPLGCVVETCDNSGAKKLKIFAVKGHKTVKGRIQAAGIGDVVHASVISGSPEMRKKTVLAVIARQKQEFRRGNGMRIKFEDNVAVVLKDDKGNPKGTLIKGPIPKEVAERYPGIAKISSIVV